MATFKIVPYDIRRRAAFAYALKAARKRFGLPAQDAAALLTAHGLDCTRGTLLAWERGQGPTTREPFASDLAVIAKIYHCSVDEFFTVEPPHEARPTLEPENRLSADNSPRPDGNGQIGNQHPSAHS